MELLGNKDSVIIKAGLKSLTNSISGISSFTTALQGNKSGAILTGLMTPYVDVQGLGSWTVNLQGQLKGSVLKSAIKSSALFHYLSGSSGDVRGSDTFLGSSDKKA